jgi:hypothetical protein
MPKRQASQKRNRKNKKSYKLKGGDGAAEYALKVYGSGDQQHAVSGTNVIAMNPTAAQGMPVMPVSQSGGDLPALSPVEVVVVPMGGIAQKGGEGEVPVEETKLVPVVAEVPVEQPTTVGGGKKRRRKGGNLLQAVLTPAILLGLNETVGKTLSNRRNKKSYTKKYRRYRK